MNVTQRDSKIRRSIKNQKDGGQLRKRKAEIVLIGTIRQRHTWYPMDSDSYKERLQMLPLSERLFSIASFSCLLIATLLCSTASGVSPAERRYSFSLTTFDPSGKLGQVEWAQLAAAQGTPIIGVVLPSGIFLAAPQVLPSPLLMEDDGTSRFSPITTEILVAHSGLSADGRVVVEKAQRMAISHEYTFDEQIPIEIFLEELSLHFQEYTMKPGVRPFGTTIVVAHLPRSSQPESQSPCFYRIDPSGTVTALGKCAVVNGNLERTNLPAKLVKMIESDRDERRSPDVVESCRSSLVSVLRETLNEVAAQPGKQDTSNLEVPVTILTACLPLDGPFSIRRYDDIPKESADG